MVIEKMKKEILKLIKKTEKKEKIKVIWAIESGSRAWNFASKDSDYDIRCMHIGKIDDYLSLNPPPKQVSLMEGDFDLESWDIKKFSELTLKSNPQIAEWLRSPITYVDSPVRNKFRKIFDEGCSLNFLRQHYLRMAKQNYNKYIGKARRHSCKKYLYVLRGISCAIYIEKKNKLPPLPYQEIVYFLPDYVEKFFEKCIKQKKMSEKAKINDDTRVINFIESYITKTFGETDTSFKKKEDLEKFMIKTIKELG